jgi:hypothetical protein
MQQFSVISFFIILPSAIRYLSSALPYQLLLLLCTSHFYFFDVLKNCEMNDKLADADVAPLSDANTNHHGGSNDSFPVM